MAENNEAQSTSGKLPPFGDFVGRERELRILEEFLTGDSSVPSIMLVHGPRGMGKSALVREAAMRKKDHFKNNILWMNRSRLAELLYDGEENSRPFPSKYKLGSDQIQETEVANYLDYFMSLDGDPTVNSEHAYAALSTFLSKRPFLLIVDDFDEHDSLGDDPYLCEQLAQIESPNKVILTTRLLQHAFQQRVFKILGLGLLHQIDVKRLVEQSEVLQYLDPMQFPNGFETVDDYIWIKSGGHAEFITRFLLPTIERGKWSLNGAKLENAIDLFAANYINQRVQVALPEEYTRRDEQLFATSNKFEGLDLQELDILFALCNMDSNKSLETSELALNLGYCPQKSDEQPEFFSLLHSLLQKRLIGCQIEDASARKNAHFTYKWIMLPFAKKYVREQLLSVVGEAVLQKRQAARWINFLQYYSGDPDGYIKQRIPPITSIFSWCFSNEEWRDVLKLGVLFSRALQTLKFHEGTPEQRILHTDVCQKTAEAAQQPGIEEWRIAVEQWILLAHLYSGEENNPELLQMALDYANQAAEIVADPRDNAEKKIWANAVCLIAKVCVQQGNIATAQEYLEKVEQEGGLNDNWVLSAYLLAKLHLGNMALKEAENWLVKLVDAFDVHKDVDIFVQSSIDLAHLYLLQEQPDKSLILLERVQKMFGELPKPSLETVQLIVKAITIEAQIAFNSGNYKECIRHLEHAVDLAKDSKFDSVVIELQRWLSYVTLRDSPFNPTDQIEKLFGDHFWWLSMDIKCPSCKEGFDFQNVSAKGQWLCPNTDCDTYFHLSCLKELGIDECPSCKTKIEIS